MTRLNRLVYLALSTLAFGLVLTLPTGCKKEKKLTGSEQPGFSTDTIIFDTVFTTVGSVTEFFTIYNPHKGVLHIDQIYIEGGEASNYRINVDGAPGRTFSNIEIPAEDSIFVFVEVTVDPNNINTPLVVSDKIIVETKGNKQHIDLVAWGQDAHFFRSPTGGAFIMPCGATLMTDKPNVFYGVAIVDENCALNIPAGAKLHFHPGSGILVYKGSLNINGTATDKVVIQGDRLEFDYRDVAGQWEGIRMVQPQNCNITHAVIKNGFYGIWADTTFSSGSLVNIKKTEVSNMASLGIYGNAGARIKAENCLVTNCGLYNVALTYGGDYDFNHCTLANYWTEGTRNTPAFYVKNWFETPSGAANVRDMNLHVNNTIIYGSQEEEFEMDLKTGAALDYIFANCFIRSGEDLSDAGHYTNLYQNHDPLFENTTTGKFKLTAGSECINTANTVVLVIDDIEDKPRSLPDVGCYEF